MHTRSALRALVSNDDHVAGADLVLDDRIDRRVLRFEDPGRSFEDQDRLIDARRLHDAAVFGDVAMQDCEAPVGAVRVFCFADAAVLGVEVGFVVVLVLAERFDRSNPSRRRKGASHSRLVGGLAAHVVFRDRGPDVRFVDGVRCGVKSARALQCAEDRENTASSSNVFHVIRGRRGDFAQRRNVT